MARPSGKPASETRSLRHVKTRPVGFSSLREPATAAASGQRRDQAGELLVHRIRAEFLEMPGLRLTVTQAARLFGASEEVCAGILSALSGEGFLRCTTDGRYGLSATGP